MNKPTRDDGDRFRGTDEDGRSARENMQRILDEIAGRRREREERRQRSFLARLLPSRR